MMINKQFKIILFTSLCLLASNSYASFYDGKSNLFCSIHQLFECDPPNGCFSVDPENINGFYKFNIDFGTKLITRAGVKSNLKSEIKSITKDLDRKLILQGVEDGNELYRDGAGWSISIMDPEGTMTLSTASNGFAVVGLGACAPKSK